MVLHLKHKVLGLGSQTATFSIRTHVSMSLSKRAPSSDLAAARNKRKKQDDFKLPSEWLLVCFDLAAKAIEQFVTDESRKEVLSLAQLQEEENQCVRSPCSLSAQCAVLQHSHHDGG